MLNRSEANSLPTFFASKTTLRESDAKQQHGKWRSFYADGVYIGHSKTYPSSKTQQQQEDDDYSPQSTYHNLLRRRFLLLRSTLRSSPPASAVATLDESHPISLPRGSKLALREWRRLLVSVDPQVVQLACMDMDSVFNVLGVLARSMSEYVRSGDAKTVKRIGAWVWALLARYSDVGQLETEKVGEIRDLGKRAVKILGRMNEDESRLAMDCGDEGDERSDEGDDDEDIVQEEEEEEEEEEGNNGETDEPEAVSLELEAAKSRLLGKLYSSNEAEQQKEEEEQHYVEETKPECKDATDVAKETRAMLDMIITIVGEYYGQRDLLASREVWNGKR